MKIRKNFYILICLFLTLITCCICGIAIRKPLTTAYADDATYENFIRYDGSKIFYAADIKYYSIVNQGVYSFNIVTLNETLCSDSSLSSDLWMDTSFKITLSYPSGKTLTRDYTFWNWKEKERKITQDRHQATSLNTVLFTSANITEQGTYTVSVSGKLIGGATVTLNNSFTFLVDTVAPIGTLVGVTNGGRTNQNVSLTWSETGLNAYRDFNRTQVYVKNTLISQEGNHTIYLWDAAGNLSLYTFEIDKTAPTGTLSGVENGGRTNGDVTFSWNEAGATATLDGQAYSKSTPITTNGNHTIILQDDVGNKTSYTFTIDKTAPVITMKKGNGSSFTDGATINSYPYFEVKDDATVTSVKITNGSETYDWTTTATQTVWYDNRLSENSRNYYSSREDLYNAIHNKELAELPPSIKYTDNEASHVYPSEVDYAFVGQNCYKYYYTKSGSAGDYYLFFNDNVFKSFIESNILNFVSSTNKALFLHEGTYKITATDDVGNTTTKSFTVDLTPPTGTLSGVTNGGRTNNDVRFTWSTAENNSATLNGSAYSSGSTISADGKYVIVLYDSVGNYNTYTFEIDKTAPTGTLSGVENGGCTNGNVSFTWRETGATATLNGVTYQSGTVISKEYTHTLILKDELGNSNTYKFTIDRTPPVGTLSGVANGGRTSSNVRFTWNEAGATATLNGQTYSKNSIIANEGNYRLTLTDIAGNSTIYTFEIDKTAPTGTLTGVENGGRTNGSVSFIWREAGATATLNGAAYQSGTVLSNEGNYLLILSDDVDNRTTYTFEIDKTAPTGTLIGVTNGGRTNQSVLFTWDEAKATATLNGAAYQGGTEISDEGNYSLILSDDVGNSTTYTFEIDKTAPTGSLSGVANGGRTNGDVVFSWNEPNANATLNLVPYTNGSSISIEGLHSILLTDSAGNTAEYIFEIDKTPAVGQFSEEGNFIENIYYFNKSISFSCEEEGARAELIFNKISSYYNFNTVITIDGTYSLKLYDDVGNVSVYNFVIDTIPFTENINYLQSHYSSHISAWFETYCYRLSDKNNYVTDMYYSFDNYADCYKYAYNRERSIVENGVYAGGSIICNYNNQIVNLIDVGSLASYINQPYYIYKSTDNGELKAYFNLSNLETSLSKFAQLSISNKYLPDTPAMQFEGDGSITAQHVIRDTIYISDSKFNLPYTQTAGYLTLNGRLSSYTATLSAGLNYITETDYAGNSVSYSIILDIEPPRILCSDILGNSLTVYENQLNNPNISTFLFSKEIVLALVDNFDETCVLKITHNRVTTTIVSSKFTCSESGLYQFSIYDSAGNTRSGNIYVSIQEPEIEIIENLDSKSRLESFTLNLKLYDTFVQLSGIEVWLKTTDDVNFIQIYKDNSNPSNEIDVSRLKYLFLTNGEYRIIISDNFGRTVTREYSFTKDAPIGAIYVRGGQLAGQRKVVNQDIYFAWTDTTCWATYTFNGGEEQDYNNKDYLTLDGEYVFFLKDAGNNQAVYSIRIDTVKPTGQLYYLSDNAQHYLSNNGKTNNNVYFQTNEENATIRYTIDGSDVWLAYNGEAFTLDGNYTVQLYDEATNVASYSFEIDKTPPEILIRDDSNNLLSSNTTTNRNIKFTWNDSSCTAILNNANYNRNTIIYGEGYYLFQLTDSCGNFSICYMTIDKTAPTGTLSGVENGGRTNGDVTFSWEEAGATATLNGAAYESGTVIAEEQIYKLVISDAAGNSTTYTFEIDKTAPTGTLNGVANGGVTNDNVTFTWEEYGATATLNGAPYSKRTYIIAENIYTLTLSDDVGNSTTYTFEIDKTAPTGTLFGVENGGYTNREVTFSWDEAGAIATLNKVTYISGTVLRSFGQYNIVLKDIAGNSSTYSFEIIHDMPVGTLTGVENGGRTSGNVTFTWEELGATATLDGKPYTRQTFIIAEGFHTIILTNKAQNSTTYTFEIDKTAPTGTLSGVENGGRTNGDVTFSWDEAGATATLNGVEFLSGATVSNQGNYIIILSDELNNQCTYTFEIDKTAPAGSLTNVTDGGSTNQNVTFTWNEAGATATLNSAAYESGTIISEEGFYIIALYDDLGNKREYSFEIDRIAPFGTFFNMSEGNVSNNFVIFTWEEAGATATLNDAAYQSGTVVSEEGDYNIVLTDKAGNSTTYTFKIDFSIPNLSFTESYVLLNDIYSFKNNFAIIFDKDYTVMIDGEIYTGELITDERSYEVTVTNLAGSINMYILLLDKTAPTGTLSGVENDGRTNGDVTFTWNEAGATATLNGAAYENGSIISEEGDYNLILRDNIGNQQFYTFEIDKTAPTGTLSGVENGGRTNGDVTFTWNEAGATATLNGTAYESGTIISEEGDYFIFLTDLSNNSTIISFTIDKTAPVGLLNGVVNGGKTNNDVSFTYSETPSIAILNGLIYEQGTLITNEGRYTLTLTDDVGNSTTYTFEIDKTAPTGTLIGVENGGRTNGDVTFSWDEPSIFVMLDETSYTKNGLIVSEGLHTIVLTDEAGNSTTYTFEIDKTAPTGTLVGVENGGLTNTDVTFKSDENYIEITLNNELYDNNTVISNEGKYTIVLTDEAGNSTMYTFEIDKTAPTGTFSGVQNESSTNNNVTFTWNEAGATATLNGEPYIRQTAIMTEGHYTLILTDTAGNSTTYTFEIDKTAPTGTLTNVTDGGSTNQDVTFSWDEPGATATLNGIAYESGTVVSEEGIHTVVLKDAIGNLRKYQFSIDRTAPILIGIENDGKTNNNVRISWDEANCKATVSYTSFDANATPTTTDYSKNTFLTNDGYYTVSVVDSCGNIAILSFEIKKAIPTASILNDSNATIAEAVSNQAYSVNSNFSVLSNYIIMINDETYNGTKIEEYGKYNVDVIDAYGNTLHFTINYADAAKMQTSNINSIIPNIILCVIAIVVVCLIITRIIISVVKKKRKLRK